MFNFEMLLLETEIFDQYSPNFTESIGRVFYTNTVNVMLFCWGLDVYIRNMSDLSLYRLKFS